MEPLHKELSQKVIGCFLTVYRKLGFGFAEKVYENALCIELRKAGIKATKQEHIKVYYENEVVGDYKADILVEDKIILELKAVSAIIEEHEAQLLNYLRATDVEVGYILNFGTKSQFLRRVFSNDRKIKSA
jgi:GxxExxY protein